jgi:cytochrome oxidase Cu insertion factor (SCO1/SenC/PrrC family)
MKKATLNFAGLLTVAAIVLSLASPTLAQSKKSAKLAPSLKVGDLAPDFKMQYFDGKDLKDVSLSDFRGKKSVVLAFYVFAFTGG